LADAEQPQADLPGELPSASTLEGVRFTAQAVLPNVVQGLFRRRSRAVAAATKLGVDRHAAGLIRRLRRSYGPGPVWVRVMKDRALLLLEEADIRRVLEGSPEPFAADPEAKRRGFSHFQPHALTISRGEQWAERRRFTEAVLDTGQPMHRLAERFAVVCRDETSRLLDTVDTAEDGQLEWERFYEAIRIITRRVVLGDAARDDTELTDLLAELMDEANGLPKEQSEGFAPFMERLTTYVAEAEAGSLVGLFGDAPAGPQTDPVGQVPHWMFALGDTLAINAFRALALIAAHPGQRSRALEELEAAGPEPGAAAIASLAYLEACLEEAMRLWPTTPLLSRETAAETELDGAMLPAGTQILISNSFMHRDIETHEWADRFSPEQWLDGGAAEDWAFNHFSHGPQGCPGAWIALFVGKSVLAEILGRRELELVAPKLDPERPLPSMLDSFRLHFALRAPASPAIS
jgi:cytochrome P450